MTEQDVELAEGPREADVFSTRFVARGERGHVRAQLEAARVLVVNVEAIGASARGRLADVIDEAIERELDARGAAPPGIGASSDADAALSDQLFRARRVGAQGVGLVLGPLRAATSPRGAVEAEDSATLRFWAIATRERPVALVLDVEDERTFGYGDPVSLARLLRTPRPDAAEPATCSSPTPTTPLVMPGPSLASAIAAAESETEAVRGRDASPLQVAAPPATVAVAVAVVSVDPVAPREPAPPAPDEPREREPVAARSLPAVTPAPRAHPAAAQAGGPGAIDRQLIGASVAVAGDEWRGWVLALTAARGPQPLSAFERLFANEYMPLANAIAAGLDDPRALHAHEEFRRTFARAYTEACPTFAVTGKRPRMVLDAPDVAARIARLHGARSTQILLVDAMRFDLGARVKVELARCLGTRGSLTDETLLWSALPTTSTRQMETLARGVDALREAKETAEGEPDPLRGRTSEMIRRIKIGSRDVYKLDLVETRLRESSAHVLDMLPEVAESVAEIVARHALTLQPRTLLFVFGDHGFTLDRDGEPHQGGASPEEVLVPGFAFLIGDVH